MNVRPGDRTSRADDLRRLLELYGSADEALAAGNYYVAARRADARPEVRAAAIALAGFHEGGHRLFAGVEPTQHLTLFAKAIACLFVEGRGAALACLDRYQLTAGPAFALREVLRRGLVRLHFVTIWKSWLERVAKSTAQFDSHGLDLQLRTVSVHGEADIRIDFNGPHYLQAMEDAVADGAHAASIFFDDLECLPTDFEQAAVPNIKIMIDHHHSLARHLDQLGRFDHLVAYGPETHERLHRMYGRRTPMFMRLSYMGPIQALSGEDAGIDMFLSGALVKDYSPRREALAHRCVEEIEAGRVILADGLLPFDDYKRLVGGARMIPAMLEEGNAIPSPRFYEALNGGMTVVTDDPDFFAWAYPDHADLFIDVETAFRIARAPKGPRPPLRLPRPRTELAAVDQMLHMALVGPLLAPGNQARRQPAVAARATDAAGWATDPERTPRLTLNGNYARQYLVASSAYHGMIGRALHLADRAASPLAVLDSARFLAEFARALSYFEETGHHLQLERGLLGALVHFAGLDRPDGGNPAPVCRVATVPAAVLLAQATLSLLDRGRGAFPDSLILAYEHLVMWRHFCGEGESLAAMIAAVKERRTVLRYDSRWSDAGPVGAVLPDMLAREVLAGTVDSRADLDRITAAHVWRLVDLLEASAALGAGRPADAAAIARRILAAVPGYVPAGDMLHRVWEVSPEAAYGSGAGTAFFRQALDEVLAQAPARIEGYGPALVAAALAAGDHEAALARRAAWGRWTVTVIVPDQLQNRRAENVRLLSDMMEAAGLA